MRKQIKQLERQIELTRIELRKNYKDEKYDIYKRQCNEIDKLQNEIRDLELKMWHKTDDYKIMMERKRVNELLHTFVLNNEYDNLWNFLQENKEYGVYTSYYRRGCGYHNQRALKHFGYDKTKMELKKMIKKLLNYESPYLRITYIDTYNHICVI